MAEYVRDSDNAQGLVDSYVCVGPKGTTMPTDVTSAPDPALHDCGWLTDAGIGEAASNQTTQKRGVNGTVIKTIKTQDDTSFTFECFERNAVTLGLIRPGSTPSTASAVAEVQTVTISGTPAGGTFTLTLPGFGSTAALAYNAPTTDVATALTTLVGKSVTVSGTAGSSYVVTFPTSMGNVAQMTAAGSFTGGTTPAISVATTTPGVAGVTTTAVKSYLGSNEKAFLLHEDFGTYKRRVCIGRGEAFLTDTIQDKPGDLAILKFRIDCYPDSNGVKYTDITSNAAEAV